VSADQSVLKSGATLAFIAAVCTALVAATYQATADRIAANEKALLEQSLQPAIGGLMFEGSVSESRLDIQPPHGLPGNDTAIVYRLYAGAEPVGALFAVTAPDGFSGPIRVLVGVAADGNVSGVRILQHRETPGYGDSIDSSRSDWVYQFTGRSLGNPVVAQWELRVDGGDFDQLTGASITPRAVLKAIREVLVYFEANREALFTQPATEEEQ